MTKFIYKPGEELGPQTSCRQAITDKPKDQLPWPLHNNWTCDLCHGKGSAHFYINGIPTFDKCPACNGGETRSVCIIPEAEARELWEMKQQEDREIFTALEMSSLKRIAEREEQLITIRSRLAMFKDIALAIVSAWDRGWASPSVMEREFGPIIEKLRQAMEGK